MEQFNFKNDYSEGAHQKVLDAIAAVNMEGNVGYGLDPYCQRAADMIRVMFSCPDAAVHFFIGGTSANYTTIAAALRAHEAVISPDTGHLNVHEGGAMEAAGHKILTCPHKDGKILPEDIEYWVDLCKEIGRAHV